MTPTNKIKRRILQEAIAQGDFECEGSIDNDGDVADAYSDFDGSDACQDYESEFRCGEVETKLKCDFSSHYESKSVAAKMDDGSWVGWTYWYGGGKYGEPNAIEWIKDVYNLECVETQEMVTVRKFNVLE